MMEQAKPFCGNAAWVWVPGGESEPPQQANSPYRIAYFRRSFQIEDTNATGVLHLSADSRYTLYCNGVCIARGPAKGDIRHQFYDTVALDEYLRPGANVLAVVVVSYVGSWPNPKRVGGPCSIMTASAAFVADGHVHQKECRQSIATPDGWHCLADGAYTYGLGKGDDQTYTGLCETLDGTRYPWGWQQADYDDSCWQLALALAPAVWEDTVTDSSLPYRMTPRMIPMITEKAEMVSHILDADPESDTTYTLPLTVLPGQRMTIVLDGKTHTTAYMDLWVSGSAGSAVRLCYAEAWTVNGQKVTMHRPKGGSIRGCTDTFLPSGGVRHWQPMHWRAFRYVEVTLEAGTQPLTLWKARFMHFHYPYSAGGAFACSSPVYNKIWSISLRTLKNCSHETFEDCPYYEQLQYAGDSHVVMLCAGYATGEWQLARQALYQFNWSRGYDGLVQSRYPSRNPQYIPSWALLWCVMLHDYWWHTADQQTVRDCINGLHSTLQWFKRYEDERGLLYNLPHWKVVDWVKEWQEPFGYPPGAEGGVSGIINLQYAYTLKKAAVLCESQKDAIMAAHYNERAAQICSLLATECWDPKSGVFYDRPDGRETSELGIAWAILAGAIQGEDAQRACAYLRTNGIAKATLYGRFYVFRALAKTGMYHQAPALLDWWEEMAATHLTTWPEEPQLARSFCHAWSCGPLYELGAGFLGVTPLAPGFDRVSINPTTAGLSWAEGVVPTRHGDIRIAWDMVGDSTILTVTLPVDLPAELHWGTGLPRHIVGTGCPEPFAMLFNNEGGQQDASD